MAHLGMHALGYHKAKNSIPPSHIPRTFSWKLLQEFFLADSLSSLQKDCLFYNTKRLFLGRKTGRDKYKDHYIIGSPENSTNEREEETFADSLEDLEEEINARLRASESKYKPQLAVLSPDGTLNHTDRCSRLGGEFDSYDEWNFMRLYLRTMLLPMINVVSALVFLLIISCRRRRILQCLVCFINTQLLEYRKETRELIETNWNYFSS